MHINEVHTKTSEKQCLVFVYVSACVIFFIFFLLIHEFVDVAMGSGIAGLLSGGGRRMAFCQKVLGE